MSKETLKIIQKLNPKMLETQIIIQCAPLLSGLKVSNLLIIQKESINDVIKIFKNSALSCVLLAFNNKKATFLIYHPIILENHLCREDVQHLLNDMGYHNYSLPALLRRISRMYQEYQNSTCEFPHEIGLLLGYPPEDVQAYITHQGQNALLTGYWQVYFRPEEKKLIFQSYDSARTNLLTQYSKGIKLDTILENLGGSNNG